jgi:hypothetical protein
MPIKITLKILNWIVVIAVTFFWLGIFTTSIFWVQVVSFTCIVAVMAAYFSVYIYWMLHDPDRLQLEGYNLEVLNIKKSTVKVSERN